MNRNGANACALLLSQFWGDNLDVDELRGLYRLASKVAFPAGRIIFSEDEPADNVFGLFKGYVRLYKGTAKGDRQIVAFAVPGDLLGMPLNAEHSCSADAIGDVILCRFSRAEFSNFIITKPRAMRRLIEFASRELDMAQRLLSMVGNISAEERLATFLLDWRNRLTCTEPASDLVPLPMFRRDIADFLGLTPETVTRTLARLEARKLIRVVPNGVILNGLLQRK